jgi:RNA polymerase sigma factor (sigma-70 family)
MKETFEELLEKNINYIYKQAFFYSGQKQEEDDIIQDLVQEGRIALYNAYQTYNEERGAFWPHAQSQIKYAMLDYMTEKTRVIRPGNNVIYKKQENTDISKPLSLNNLVDENGEILEYLIKSDSTDVEPDYDYLHQAIEKLSKNEYKELLRLYNGFNGEKPLTFRDLAKIKGTTYQNLQIKYKKALNELRTILSSKNVK